MTNPVLRYWPHQLLREARMLWELQGMTVGSGQTASGAMPMTRIDGGGLWKATLGQVGLFTADKRRAWRALSRICKGGAQPIILEVRETIDSPWPLVSGVAVTPETQAQVPHDDDSLFDDDTGYESGLIEIKNVGAVVLRATAMTVALVAGSDLQGGEYFSIDHVDLRHRLYSIETAIDNDDGTWAITFSPPLRADIADATWLEFDHPKCVMKLATPDAMDATFEPPFNSNPDVSFIEAFPPFPV